jgi:predicted regulator of Ras-like GTPase activity (Roadblock/LC7/MglB family)
VFLERLNAVADRVGGAVAVSLVAADGIPIESVSSAPNVDVESAAAELVALARSIAQEQRELDAGELRQLTVVGTRSTMLLSRLAGRYWLLAVLAPEASVGRARFELRRAELQFEDDLD